MCHWGLGWTSGHCSQGASVKRGGLGWRGKGQKTAMCQRCCTETWGQGANQRTAAGMCVTCHRCNQVQKPAAWGGHWQAWAAPPGELRLIKEWNHPRPLSTEFPAPRKELVAVGLAFWSSCRRKRQWCSLLSESLSCYIRSGFREVWGHSSSWATLNKGIRANWEPG